MKQYLVGGRKGIEKIEILSYNWKSITYLDENLNIKHKRLKDSKLKLYRYKHQAELELKRRKRYKLKRIGEDESNN